MKRILGFFSAVVLSSTSCTSVNVDLYKDEKPQLILENYLSGKLTAHGLFTDRSGIVKKRFIVDLLGEWDEEKQTLTLKEDFRYSDGSSSQRIWTVVKKSLTEYVGTAGDVVGEATGRSSGNAFYWEYTMALDVDGTTYNVFFKDWMFLVDDKVMLNTSKMSKWGFHLGDVTLSFHKAN